MTAKKSTPEIAPPDRPDEGTPRVEFDHWFFHKVEDLHFQRSEQSGEPAVLVNFAKNEVSMSFRGVKREFKIADDSADGRMLDLVANSLKFVKGLRMGDPLPREILTREASWELTRRHQTVAYQRVSMQLVNWMTGGQQVITEPDELLQLADDPQIKKQINRAFGEAAEKLGLGRDHKEQVVQHVEVLAKELAYIEALRDRFRKVKAMEDKIQTLRRLYGRERSVLQVADQVARLGGRAVEEFNSQFLEIDAQTGEILSVLRNLQSQIAYIRDKRDELYVKLIAWDDILGQWDKAAMKIQPGNPELLRRTYHFLAPRYMLVKEWVLMTKLTRTEGTAGASQPGGSGKQKTLGHVMRW